jgi:uncharacterized RDD family membrane protein YckC
MEYEDTIAIATPEGVELELALAGVGSRFGAALLDALIQWSVLIAAAIVLGASGVSGSVTAIVFSLLAFFVLFAYDVLFEVLAGGRTPGKRWSGLRVVRSGGQPVGFRASAIRNIVRIADFLPSAYLVGMTAILISRRNQRLGDIAADTLVIRDGRARLAAPTAPPAVADEPIPPWDVSGISGDELALARHFLERRHTLAPDARAGLAAQLAETLRPKVPGAEGEGSPERFVELLVRARAAR